MPEMDVRMKGVYCPSCKNDKENDKYIEISTFSDYYGVEKVEIYCLNCKKHHYYSLVQTEKD